MIPHRNVTGKDKIVNDMATNSGSAASAALEQKS
jgi:hypothetical protein